jgi:AcrR family transcriptional regulator
MDSTSTRERLVLASAAVFLEEGIDRASMDSVRQRAGVSNGSLYHYFPTKAKLVDALYADTLRDFHQAVLACLARDPSCERGVKGMIRAYVRWVSQNPERARLLHELRRYAGTAMDAANTDAYKLLFGWIQERVAAGDMRDVPRSVWMALVFAPALALTPMWIVADRGSVAPQVRKALEHAAWMSVAATSDSK